jgi:hypothetical protein
MIPAETLFQQDIYGFLEAPGRMSIASREELAALYSSPAKSHIILNPNVDTETNQRIEPISTLAERIRMWDSGVSDLTRRFSGKSAYASNRYTGSTIFSARSSRFTGSTFFPDQPQEDILSDKEIEDWLSEITLLESILDHMAVAVLDQDFKDELSAIEQWFKVLSETERVTALYALAQQTTQDQIRFMTQVFLQMRGGFPVSLARFLSNDSQRGTSSPPTRCVLMSSDT